MLSSLIAIYCVLALFDIFFTNKMLKKYGSAIETNSLIRWLADKLGLFQGVAVGVSFPSLLSLGLVAKWPLLIGVLAGMRITLAYWQAKILLKNLQGKPLL